MCLVYVDKRECGFWAGDWGIGGLGRLVFGGRRVERGSVLCEGVGCGKRGGLMRVGKWERRTLKIIQRF
jgi:hypothetical protein